MLLTRRRLSQLVGEISREVYATRSVPESQRLEAAQRLTCKLDAWKASLPPLLSTIRASSLMPPYRRQVNVLRLAYNHAMIHANRSFLLSALSDRQRTSVTQDKMFDNHTQKCVQAARSVVELVNSLMNSDERSLFHSVCVSEATDYLN
jgi:hypothetical protein